MIKPGVHESFHNPYSKKNALNTCVQRAIAELKDTLKAFGFEET